MEEIIDGKRMDGERRGKLRGREVDWSFVLRSLGLSSSTREKPALDVLSSPGLPTLAIIPCLVACFSAAKLARTPFTRATATLVTKARNVGAKYSKRTREEKSRRTRRKEQVS